MSMLDHIHALPEATKATLDVVAAVSAVSALIGLLPSITAGFGLAWYCVLLYDRFIKKRK